ncbi:hypothetical protein [Halobiforma nitratireducens]|uniref:Uncharacterized protein n=1 Tax=Halobiforma nitratireducens JCM 10879 TaxID=1227454 RepID=M0M9X4_9EURY|nr:hypothetical protein [Halobiforma nitratireducens]EMA42582.1 hypothetical protein C446_03943 [Halobiforma nitratireducens JCM 10879]
MNQSRTEPTDERVAELLEAADAVGERLVSSDRDSATERDAESGGEPAADPLLEAAERADTLVATADPSALLEAVGLDTLPDGSEPASMPDAIARGDPDAVEDLERLLSLARLADRSDEEEAEIGAATSGLRAVTEDDEGDEGDDGDEFGDNEAGKAEHDRSVEDERRGESVDDEPTAGDDGDGIDPEVEDTEDEATTGPEVEVEDRLRDALESDIANFGDGVERLQEGLEAIGGGEADTEGEGDRDDASESDPEANELDHEGRLGGEGATAESEDDDLLDPDLGSSGRESPDGAARHSTVAPSPSKRADMSAVRRFSTMPDSNDGTGDEK